VGFTIPNPLDTNWLGIYNANEKKPENGYDWFWMGMCGDQSDECDAMGSGDVKFKITGPKTTSYDDYPMNPGKYKV
jgi:hypothetical protein